MRAGVQKAKVEKPQLERMTLVRGIMSGFRAVLDEELQPMGITMAQVRVLWAVELKPEVSGAEIARYCEMTPQSAQAVLATLEKEGLIRRRHSVKSERVLVAEVTSSGRKVLTKAKAMAERLYTKMWGGMTTQELAAFDKVLRGAVEKLER